MKRGKIRKAAFAALMMIASAHVQESFALTRSEERALEPVKNEFRIVSPVPTGSTVEMITQPARLKTLEGKTIALVGGSFSASVTHAVIRDLLVENFHCRIYFMDEIGKGGSYNPINPSDQTLEFQRKLREYGVDAVISGNCGCGICTVKETGNALAAEVIGIPSVVVGARSFIAQIESTGFNRGVPVVRTAAYEGAFASDDTPTQQYKARYSLYDQVVQALTTEITESERERIAGVVGSAADDDEIFTGSYQRVQEFYRVNEMTDGLPVVPPTRQKVDYYLSFSGYAADDCVCERDGSVLPVPPANRKVKAYQVAVNAVLSGCSADLMPLCVAVVKALGDEAYLREVMDGTRVPLAIVSGPIGRQVEVDHAQGQTTEEVNLCLARFIAFALANLADVPRTGGAAFGTVQPLVVAEDEAAALAVGWQPCQVQAGYRLDASAVTMTSFAMWGNNLTPATDWPEEIMKIVAWDVTEKNLGGLGAADSAMAAETQRTILVTIGPAAEG